MKCPKCNGSGRIKEMVEWIATDTLEEYESTCPKCNGTGEVEMTNEEWLHSLNTEELAEWFANSGFVSCILRNCANCKYYDKKNDDCNDGYDEQNAKEMWVEWLEQPHKEDE